MVRVLLLVVAALSKSEVEETLLYAQVRVRDGSCQGTAYHVRV